MSEEDQERYETSSVLPLRHMEMSNLTSRCALGYFPKAEAPIEARCLFIRSIVLEGDYGASR